MTNTEQTQGLKEKITDSLLKRGYVISPQRKILIAALCEEQEIADVEKFWITLRSQHDISWATVYNNIKLLIHSGWILREGNSAQKSIYRIVNNRIKQ